MQIDQFNDHLLTSGRIHAIELLIFDIVLVVLNQYFSAINDMPRAINIHGYLVDILIIRRLEVMDNECKTYYPVTCCRAWQISRIVEIELGHFFGLGN